MIKVSSIRTRTEERNGKDHIPYIITLDDAVEAFKDIKTDDSKNEEAAVITKAKDTPPPGINQPRSGTMMMKPADGYRRKFKPEYKRNQGKYPPRYNSPGTGLKQGSRCLSCTVKGHWARDRECTRFNM